MKQKITFILNTIIKERFQVNEKINFRVEIPKKIKFGDFSTNIAMILASKLRQSPVKIAEDLIKELEQYEIFDKIEIAGKGFLNFFLTQKVWIDTLNELNTNDNYFKIDLGKNQKVLIEFVSANPTGPLHIGHGRGAVLGDVLANLFKFLNFNVTKEYYINDAGNQMYILGNSIYLRLRELLGEKIDFPEDHYQGEYIIQIAKNLLEKYGKEIINQEIDFFTKEGIHHILPEIKDDLKAFGIEFDSWFSEKSLFDSGKVEEVLNILKVNGNLYEKDKAWWIKVEDDEDRVVIKSDGSYTYLASDIAYHKNKYERGFEKLIDIWGADHHGYIPRIKSAIKLTGEDPEKLEILLVQMVNLLRDGERLPLSTRKGKFITLREVVDEVGKDAARFIFMTRKYDAQLDFDLTLAKKQSNENPVYYVQYAHARICSILRNNDSELPEKAEELSCEDDIKILKKLTDFKDILISAAKNLEPHLITFYLMELAGEFHSYYNKHKVLGNNTRLLLISAIKKVIKTGLDILGVDSPERM